ncbi:MAG: superoxide dismutase family protein [Balneola sp.]|nr:MAG: superoxide dismutase family protein [Balneola sp.]
MKRLSIVLLGLFIFAACESEEKEPYESKTSDISKLVAVIHPLGDSGVMGIVEFTQIESGVQVSAIITGLNSDKHGFHIHQFGNCTASDGTSAGGHFDPFSIGIHGQNRMKKRHMGDMGNLEALNGKAEQIYTDPTILMEEIIGRGIIIHAGEDDLTSQPSGASGPRVACGVIGVAE